MQALASRIVRRSGPLNAVPDKEKLLLKGEGKALSSLALCSLPIPVLSEGLIRASTKLGSADPAAHPSPSGIVITRCTGKVCAGSDGFGITAKACTMCVKHLRCLS